MSENVKIAEKALIGFPMKAEALGFSALQKVLGQVVEALDSKDAELASLQSDKAELEKKLAGCYDDQYEKQIADLEAKCAELEAMIKGVCNEALIRFAGLITTPEEGYFKAGIGWLKRAFKDIADKLEASESRVRELEKIANDRWQTIPENDKWRLKILTALNERLVRALKPFSNMLKKFTFKNGYEGLEVLCKAADEALSSPDVTKLLQEKEAVEKVIEALPWGLDDKDNPPVEITVKHVKGSGTMGPTMTKKLHEAILHLDALREGKERKHESNRLRKTNL